jgi:hypothetical protein
MDREQIETEIRNMKQILRQTDYVALKLAEGVTAPGEYTAVLEERQACRTRINDLEVMLNEI